MHELGLCEGIVDAVLARAGGRTVRAATVRVGGHVVDEQVLRQGFGLAAAGTPAADARLELVLTPMQARCASGHEGPVGDPLALVSCPVCGSVEIEVTGDEAVVLESITVEGPAGARPATGEEG